MGIEAFPFTRNPPAENESILTLLRDTIARPLPNVYIDFLRRGNGGEGYLGDAYVMLWRAEELLEFNRDYQVSELAPELFLIGSNGSGEAYAFDQGSDSSAVFAVPFIGMEYQYIQKVADSFPSFVTGLDGDEPQATQST